jgi:butyryl-CoA dehydrogenase
MNLSLTEEQFQFQTELRNFAQHEVAPFAAEFDKTGTFPWDTLKKMAAKGYLGIPIPKEYGGLGLDTICYLIALEELSCACSATGVITAVHTSVGTYPIYLFGSEEQKQKFVIPLAKGEKLGAFALTEPAAGSDAGAIATIAEPNINNPNEYILNGSKVFITNGTSAESVIVIAVTDRSKGLKGISAIIVEKGTPGFSIGQGEEKLGLHASEASELIFDNCIIPKDNLLGTPGDGFKISMITLDAARLGIAAQALGVAKAAFFECLRYVKGNNFNGKPLSKMQSIQFTLADMTTELEAARLLMYKAAYLKDNNKAFTKEASMAKVLATENAMKFINITSRLMGEFGYTKRSPMERFLRDVKVMEIYEGTSEIQRLIISKQLMK